MIKDLFEDKMTINERIESRKKAVQIILELLNGVSCATARDVLEETLRQLEVNSAVRPHEFRA